MPNKGSVACARHGRDTPRPWSRGRSQRAALAATCFQGRPGQSKGRKNRININHHNKQQTTSAPL
eukprot:10110267-Alexandrium_andersonii.AAC.1